MSKGNILMVFDENELDQAKTILTDENCQYHSIENLLFFSVTDLDHYYIIHDKCEEELTKYILLYDNSPNGSRISHQGMIDDFQKVKNILNIPIEG